MDILLLFLRILLSVALYAFLAWVVWILWRDLRKETQRSRLAQATLLGVKLQTENGFQTIQFTSAEVLIGRDPTCNCILDDKTVSTQHARLRFHHQQWWLEDLQSTNGTFLNQEKVVLPVVLANGDQVRCGNVNLQIEIVGDMRP